MGEARAGKGFADFSLALVHPARCLPVCVSLDFTLVGSCFWCFYFTRAHFPQDFLQKSRIHTMRVEALPCSSVHCSSSNETETFDGWVHPHWCTYADSLLFISQVHVVIAAINLSKLAFVWVFILFVLVFHVNKQIQISCGQFSSKTS